ncbi:origin recognition complex subunit [Anaeramoeba flamelloides]|uniref:Origin recognition complex subunit n=1 Tax=Anaeramoeba flamelloides TaxID=1746091 RepID=A0AAV7ZKG2_9EUKA|nr:origin recognition complex subunit [Anaeramoeba flamelloides]
MDKYDSVSKGCFLLQPSNESIRNIGTNDDPFSLSSYFQDLEEEKITSIRNKLYLVTLKSFEKKIDNLIEDLDISTFQEMANFLFATNFISKQPFEIPTAILYSGSSLSDHESVINGLIEFLDQLETPIHFSSIVLRANECNTIKIIFNKIMNTLLLAQEEFENFSLVDKKTPKKKSNKVSLPFSNSKKTIKTIISDNSATLPQQFNMQSILGWYKYQQKKARDFKLIIIFENIESFQSDLVDSIISVFSSYQHILDTSFVFDLATGVEPLTNYLSRKPLSKLYLEKFTLSRSIEMSIKLIMDLIFDDQPIQISENDLKAINSLEQFQDVQPLSISYELFSYLYRSFKNEHLSISQFIKTLKAVLCEYFTTPYSLVRLKKNNTLLITPHANHLKEIRALPSFRRYLSTVKDHKLAGKLLTNDETLSEMVTIFLSRIYLFINQWKRALTVILKILSHFIQLLEEIDSEEFHQEVTSFRSLRDKIRQEETQKTLLKSNKQKISQLNINEKNKNKNNHLDGKKTTSIDNQLLTKNRLARKKMGNRKRRQMLIQQTNQNQKSEKNSQKLIMLLKEFAINRLPTPSTLTLNELVFLKFPEELEQQLVSKTRILLHESLEDPNFEKLLFKKTKNKKIPTKEKNKELDGKEMKKGEVAREVEGEGDEEWAGGTNLFDINLVYNLYQQYKKKINLKDWYDGFVVMLEENKLSTEYSQIRFMSVVTNLQMLGLVKLSSTKGIVQKINFLKF